VDFAKPKNQFTAAVALIMGIANFTLTTGALSFSGIILGTVAAIVVYHLMHWISVWRGTDGPDAQRIPASTPEGDLTAHSNAS
jgi:NCS2 family nucleobase:cation symporter-2